MILGKAQRCARLITSNDLFVQCREGGHTTFGVGGELGQILIKKGGAAVGQQWNIVNPTGEAVLHGGNAIGSSRGIGTSLGNFAELLPVSRQALPILLQEVHVAHPALRHAQERNTPGFPPVGGALPTGFGVIPLPTANLVSEVSNLVVTNILGVPLVGQVKDVWRLTTGKGGGELLGNVAPRHNLVINGDPLICIGEFLEQRWPQFGLFGTVRRLPKHNGFRSGCHWGRCWCCRCRGSRYSGCTGGG